jgi:tetratricopeptide (TPR) repeat protein
VIDMTSTHKRRLSVAAMVLALAAPPAAADFDTAMTYLRSGKYLEAAGEFQALVDESPEYADGYHLLGICFLKSKKYQDAEKNFLKAIELNGDKFEYYFNLANSYVAQEKHDKVVRTLNNAEGLAPDSQKYMVHKLRGGALANQKKWAEAIDDLEQAVAAKPDPATQAQLGKAYFSVGDNAAAVTALRKAIGMQASANTYELLVEAMINVAAKASGEADKKTKYGRALAEAEKFLKFSPTSLDARYLVGRAALGASQFDKAIGAFQDVLKQKPGHCNAMANMGKAHTAKGDWANALGSLESATTCDPKMGLAWEGMGFVLQKTASKSKDYSVQQSSYERAITAYEKAQAIKPSASISKAIEDCKHNLTISRENQGMDVMETEQERKIAEEEERLAEEQRKREEWAAKQEEDD